MAALRLHMLPRPVVMALVGAGGKSTLMQRLAREVTAASLRVLFTTTTRLWHHQFASLPDPHLVGNLEEASRVSATAGPLLTLAQRLLPEEGKVQGLPPAWVDALAEQGDFDLIVVEADGSRERPLKAPGEEEPLVPARTSLFISVAGWRAMGRPLTPAHVHRAERAAVITGHPVGSPITPEMMITLLTHPQGGLKGVPGDARVVWLINQVNEADTMAIVEAMARELLARADVPPTYPPAEVILAALAKDPPVHAVVGRVAAVVLAAGAGTRFGGAKQVAMWQGRPLIHHVLDAVAASDVDEIVVVIGAHAHRVREAIETWQSGREVGIPVQVVMNERWQEGQSTSVRAGLQAVGPVSAVLFPLADQPRVPPALLNALIAKHRHTLAPIVQPLYRGIPGSPVLFDCSLFPDLMALRGDIGGRAIVRAHPEYVHHVDWPDATAALDVDTPEALA